eukprot:scaffold2389_cov262-Pinguiococcus_pyrenoidosus.AAC.14
MAEARHPLRIRRRLRQQLASPANSKARLEVEERNGERPPVAVRDAVLHVEEDQVQRALACIPHRVEDAGGLSRGAGGKAGLQDAAGRRIRRKSGRASCTRAVGEALHQRGGGMEVLERHRGRPELPGQHQQHEQPEERPHAAQVAVGPAALSLTHGRRRWQRSHFLFYSALFRAFFPHFLRTGSFRY